MKVTGVRTVPFYLDMGRPIGDANLIEGAPLVEQTAVLVETDEGLTGTGIGGPGIESALASMFEVVDGSDPREVRAIWERLYGRLFKAGYVGPAAGAAGALDIALWDLKAQYAGDPLWRLLGGRGDPVPAYASGLDMPLDDDALVDWYRQAASLGITAAKIKVGRNIEDDLRRLGLVHAALGGNRTTLMADANERWTVKQAVRWAARLEREFDLEWIEEPVSRWDLQGLKEVSEALRCAVATGENLSDPQLFKLLVESRAADVLQTGVIPLGFTGCLRVAELASAHDLPFSLMGTPGLAAHVAAVSPTHTAMEVTQLSPSPIWAASLKVAAGAILLNQEPGHGFRLDEARCAAGWQASGGRPVLGAVYGRGRLSDRWPDSGPPRSRGAPTELDY